MHTSRAPLAAALGLALLLTAPIAFANECAPRFDDGWARLPPIDMPVLGGFGTLHNPCTADTTVTAASSPDFEEVQVHETRHEDGMMRMREVETLAVPAGESAELAPGGLHLMLMRPLRSLEAGDRVEVTFTLDDGTTVDAGLEVR